MQEAAVGYIQSHGQGHGYTLSIERSYPPLRRPTTVVIEDPSKSEDRSCSLTYLRATASESEQFRRPNAGVGCVYRYPHLGQRVSSLAEGAHAKLKLDLISSQGSALTLVEAYTAIVEDYEREVTYATIASGLTAISMFS